jgi:5-methylcytosine-specific restriction enzyme subunit McrC
MSNKNIIQVFEYQTLKVGDDQKFTAKHFNALGKYGYKTKEKYYTVGNNRIKFNNYVGVIQVDNITIEILPKADNEESGQSSKLKWHDALIHMLHECKLIKLNSITNAQLKIKSASILDLFFDLFLTETELIYKQGLRKQYRKVEENIHSLKGKLLFTNHIKKNAFHKERFYVSRELFDPNNKLNQILYKAIVILRDISNNPNFTTRINHLLLNFENIEDKNITSTWFDNIIFDRNTDRYKQAITLAKLIILRYAPDLKGGRENVLAIMFDMNLLYENYIFRKLQKFKNEKQTPITKIKEQNRLPFWESKGIKADIVIEGNNKTIVIDTKWKVLKDPAPSDADLKQMFVYNLHYEAHLSILLYPKTIHSTQEKKAFRHDNYNEKYCQLAFVDLFDKDDKILGNLGSIIYDDLLKNNF